MSLRSFMYASEVLRLQQTERFHVETESVPEPTPAEMRERNAQSMAALQGMMAGVKKR